MRVRDGARTDYKVTAKTFDFPVWLKGTPEQQAAESQRQDLLRASFTRARQTESERLIGRGALLEATARGNLEAAGGNEEARILAQSQMADAIAMQGRFSEAAGIHPDPVRQEHFQNIVAAIQMPDDEKCDCEDTKSQIGDSKIAITPRFERAVIYSPVHQGTVSLVECSVCHHMNARPLRSRLLPMQAALSQSEAMKRPMLSDAQVLAVKK